MPALTDHECFRQPQDENIRLWRYMDFTKFVFLISTSNLFFCRSDLFTDPFEGAYTKANVQLRHDLFKNTSISEQQIQNAIDHNSISKKRLRERVFINCWHANEYESAAMWNLYAKTNESVAVETDYLRLKNALPDHTFLGLVNYIDYETDWVPEDHVFHSFMHKRKSFEHEKEVRAVICDFSGNRPIFAANDNKRRGINIPVELNNLIKKIHISPTAQTWLVDLTREIATKYEVTANIIKSDLYSEPIF